MYWERLGRIVPARLLAVAMAFGLVAASCSDDEGAQDGAPTTAPEAAAPAADEVEGADSQGEEGGLVFNDEQIGDAELLEACQQEGELSVYTTNPEEQMIALTDVFSEDAGGIDMGVFRGPGSELSQRILAEAEAGVHAFDVVNHTNPGDMQQFRDLDMLVPHEVPFDHDRFVAQAEIDPEHYFYPFTTWLYVPAYNTAIVDEAEAPSTWDEVIAPAFEGQLGITPAGVGGTGLAQAAFQQEVLGDDWIRGLGEVEPVIFSSTVTVADNLGRGELAVAIGAESVLAPQVAAGAPVELVYPEEGVIAGNSYTGVSANASNPNCAILFQNWYLSKRGQDTMALIGAGRPVRDDAESMQLEGVDLPPMDEINIWFSDLSTRLENRDELVAHWNELVGYTE